MPPPLVRGEGMLGTESSRALTKPTTELTTTSEPPFV